MDSKDHPVVQQGIKAAELTSTVCRNRKLLRYFLHGINYNFKCFQIQVFLS